MTQFEACGSSFSTRGRCHRRAAGHLLHGEGTTAANHWFKDYETPLFEGHANGLAHLFGELAQTHPSAAEGLRGEAHYFAENQRRMQ